MNGHEIDALYAERVWSWDWFGRPIGVHPAIRPADADGYIHQNGEMLHLEGKVTRSKSMLPAFTVPQLNANRDMGNLTILLIHADQDHWLEHRPTRLCGYQILPSLRFPWEGGRRYVPLDAGFSDEDTLRTVLNVVIGWCWWAGTKEHT